jgi:uncharacterized protein YjdB
MPVGSVAIIPDTASIIVGQAAVLSVLVKDSVGNTVTGKPITWSSSDSVKARVSSFGVVSGLAVSNVDITATVEGKSGTARIRILAPPSASVMSVSVSVPRSAFRVGENLQAAALPLDSLGGVLTGRNIVWSTSNAEVVTVSSSGLISGVGPGSATVSADVDGKVGSAIVQVSLVPVSTVTVTPGTESVSAGATVSFSAVLKDSAGRVLTGRSISWTSSTPSVASVNDAGVATGILVGTTNIVAAAEGKQGQAALSVNTLTTPVASITLDPANTNMSGGATKQLTATLRDANGNVLGGRTITWTSSNPDRATVSASGLVTAAPVDAPVVITASVEGKTATSSIGIISFVRLSSGSGFSCGLTVDGTAYCWGQNGAGQLGDGTSINRLTPVKVATELKFVAIASGTTHTCAIAVGSMVYCWGANSAGQLGIVTAGSNSQVPVAVAGGYTFVSVAPGQYNTCATTATREVYCWGRILYWDDYYQSVYGFGAKPPTLIGTGMVAVVSGMDGNYCSVDPAGLGYCWVLEYHSFNGPVAPIIHGPVSSIISFTTLRMGLGHVCGISSSGPTYCWGENRYGQLGDGTTTDRSAPTQVAGGLSFESLAAGGSYEVDDDAQKSYKAGFSCGLTTAGKAYCWGSNRFGELGVGSATTIFTTPQAVSGSAAYTGLRAGASHVCGLAVGGAAYCWGSNNTGQFGDGTTTSSRVPTLLFGK